MFDFASFVSETVATAVVQAGSKPSVPPPVRPPVPGGEATEARGVAHPDATGMWVDDAPAPSLATVDEANRGVVAKLGQIDFARPGGYEASIRLLATVPAEER